LEVVALEPVDAPRSVVLGAVLNLAAPHAERYLPADAMVHGSEPALLETLGRAYEWMGGPGSVIHGRRMGGWWELAFQASPQWDAQAVAELGEPLVGFLVNARLNGWLESHPDGQVAIYLPAVDEIESQTVGGECEARCRPNASPYTGPGTNTWILGDPPACLVIDPGSDDSVHLDSIDRRVGPMAIASVLVTHGHSDHIGGAELLAQRHGARLLRFPELAAGDVVNAGQISVTAIATPGHTSDHLGFWMPADRVLFQRGSHSRARQQHLDRLSRWRRRRLSTFAGRYRRTFPANDISRSLGPDRAPSRLDR